MATNAHVLAAGALGLALGLTAATLWSGADPTPTPPAASTGRDASRSELAVALAAERDARAALEAENAELRTALAGTATAQGAPAGTHAGVQPDAAAAPSTGSGQTAGAGPNAPGQPPVREAFDTAALAALGLPDAEIARLRDRYAAFQLDELYLRDEARRGGWLREPRYQRELRGLRDALRDELGDDAYDALLYASTQDNRVVINQPPIPGSPAERAGLQAGDAIVSYGGDRIFDPFTLVAATAARPPGEQTEIRLERDGDELRVFVPRGPLGTTLRRDRRPPDTR